MKLAGYQPQYFPRLHYFARILDADVFTISDHVQFVKAHKYPREEGGFERHKSYQADTPIKTSTGTMMLSVPVEHHGFQAINATSIMYGSGRWQEKHIKGIRINYAAAERFSAVFPSLEQLLLPEYSNLAELNTATILWGLARVITGEQLQPENLTLGRINEMLKRPHPFKLREVVIKSQAGIEPPHGNRDATDWIIDTCQLFGADEYVCGGTARAAYLDEPRLLAAGVKPVQQSWELNPYAQLWPKIGFVANLSIIDLLMNVPLTEAQAILGGGGQRAASGTAPGAAVPAAEKERLHQGL